MTARQLASLLDAQGLLRIDLPSGRVMVPVTITDARESFGSDQVQVQPVGGSGTAWVALDRVEVSS